ncbi:alpha/beta hydrolase [uncultured Roseibium sp.]|uniref:alpha/beta fold hydrolase n=1 Tax=uncultured Roseibium sp. TaxID=1936171 RepID=UPI0032173818
MTPTDNAPAIRPAERCNRLIRPGNRKLSWAEWGPADGRPVLFFTGAGMGASLGFGIEHLDGLGLRLIVPDRPGLGHSDPDPEKSLASLSEDMAAVLDELEAERIPAVGFSQGAVFAFAFAMTGRVSRLAIVSGQDDLGRGEFAEILPQEVRSMVETAASDPEGFTAFLEGFADAEGLYDLVLGMSSDVDRELYSTDPVGPAYRAALADGFTQGPAGYVRDTLLALRPWPFNVAEMPVPVTLWYGEKDTSPVHAPDFGLSLSRRLPDVRRIVDPERGSAILWLRAGEILADLLD